jgi:tuftelin-interacting protein 11
MDEEQEYERFDVEGDFEGGEWVGGEFFAAGRRRKRRQGGDDALYGVFAEGGSSGDSSGGEESGGGKKMRRRREGGGGGGGGGGRQNYSKPVGFVGGGVVTHGDAGEEAGEAEEEGGARAGLGGGGGAAGGLGFRPAAAAVVVPPPRRGGASLGAPAPAAADEDGASEEDPEAAAPTAFGRRVHAAAAARRREGEAAARAAAAGGPAGLSAGSGGGLGLGGGLGSGGGLGLGVRGAAAAAPAAAPFEAHTKGIGSKLLSKMGWREGEGLGRAGTGIAKPLEAVQRPKGLGMGYGERRAPLPAAPAAAAVKPAAATAKPAAAEPRGAWKRGKAAARAARTFRTADELLAEREAAGAAPPRMAVVDMRGPRARVVTDLSQLDVSGDHAAAKEEPFPELQHNLRLLVDLAAADVARLDARLRHDRDTGEVLRREAARLEAEAAATAAAAGRAAALLGAAERARAPGAPPGEARAALAAAAAAHPAEYAAFGLPAVALAAALPALRAELAGWAPLADPGRPLPVLAAWRPLLAPRGGRAEAAAAARAAAEGAGRPAADPVADPPDAYARLVVSALMPPLRAALAAGWDPATGADALEALVSALSTPHALPAGMLAHVMGHLVLPRLVAAVEAWDPRAPGPPAHAWLHPWLPHLGAAAAGELWPRVRAKFGAALRGWHPGDASARAALAPWARVFAPRDFETLLRRAILPPLAAALAGCAVDPGTAAADAAPLEWAAAWAGLAPAALLADLLEAHFFPRWHAALRHWLAGAPDFDEVARWYLSWKARFPDALLADGRVRAQLAAGLDAMNAAVEGAPLPAAPQAPAAAAPPPAADGRDVLNERYGAAHAPAARPAALPAREASLRELIAEFAAEAGVAFAPRPGRARDGLPVYAFGRVSCVVDAAAGLVRAQLGGGGDGWRVAPLEEVLAEHKRREAAAR